MNNPLKYIDPSGYYRELYRPDDYDEIKESSLGGGGIDRINWPEWCRPGGPSNTFEFDLMLATEFDRMSGGTNSVDYVIGRANNGYYKKKFIENSDLVNHRWVTETVNTGKYSVYKMKTEFGEYYDIMEEITVKAVKEYYLDPSFVNASLFMNYFAPTDRAGNSSFISKHDATGLIGIDAGLGLTALAAHGNSMVSLISAGATVGSIGINAVLLASTLQGILNKDNPSWGDWTRLGMNALFTTASAIAPFSGNIPGIVDFYGNFEYLYTQMDVLQNTGQWIYLNPYDNIWKSINLQYR